MRYWLLFLTGVILAGCADQAQPTEPSKYVTVTKTEKVETQRPLYGVIPTILNFVAVSPKLFQELYDTGEMTVIDIRKPSEVLKGRIFPQALEINFSDSDFREKITGLDRDKKYLVYDEDGVMAGEALTVFDVLGFKEVYTLSKGKTAWDEGFSQDEVLSTDREAARIINISAKMFAFSTTEIRAKQGEKVLLKINNLDVTHGMNIPALGQSGDEEILLDTTEKGAFPFGCNNLCGMGHLDMKGQIIIE